METSSRENASRRWIGRLVRAGLIMVAVFFVWSWIWRKVPHNRGDMTVAREPVAEAALAPGDLRIYNRDSTVDLVLQGSRILAGLSPKTVAKVKAEMEKSSSRDTSGIGGLIATTVKQTVANTIGTHVAYAISDIRNIRYEDGRLIIERKDGSETRLFGDTKVNGTEQGKTFDERDAQRFIEAVRARKRELGT